ncbi:DUF4245 domain-containing protein [Naumannella sp. ID2617S]|uniref:DUF4245 domain-containing protein n=1 Tax=Enemella dayhoffiae TaxID=2016507 RepID=A0A255GQQ8_9ACTN|nr:DUF4245 domain-containing protein [Enemella dayhoffiae]NNG18350.1 DUF4245 domain-containing protein [Naumannella sp. ID2617S]OYO18139.1 hypothetical protein CGZ93_16460 [Enemella dayhoffiae]
MANNQARASAGDMIRSLAVIMIPILLLTWLLTSRPKDYEVKPVDWRPVLAQARAEAGWPVLAPVGLPETGGAAWVANVASWVRLGQGTAAGPAPRNQWQLGLLNSDKVHYAVTQGDGRTDDLVKEKTREGHQVGEDQLLGRTWQRLESPDGRTRALVHRTEQVTTVVSADTDFNSLLQFAGTLSDR